jgi:hypothetical protein
VPGAPCPGSALAARDRAIRPLENQSAANGGDDGGGPVGRAERILDLAHVFID